MMNDSDGRLWNAVCGRDYRMAGRFVYAVRTTGVYCRPGCASRRPRRENTEYFAGAAEAEAAGYRACRRCWSDSRRALVEAACRRMASSDSSEGMPGLAELAEEAGLSANHFHRVVRMTTGVTPLEFASAVRSDRFLAGLEAGLSVTEAVYEAGYSSPARAYEGLRKRTSLRPSEVRNGAKRKTIWYACAECFLGVVLAAMSERGICAVLLGDNPDELVEDLRRRFHSARIEAAVPEECELIRRALAEVREPSGWEALPLDISGTAFQCRVWKALREVPRGDRATYREIAEKIGSPKASRAVAGACAANPAAVLIPCHRAVRSDGALGGYRWGAERKRRLLERE